MFKTILLAVDVNDPKGSERPAATALQLAASNGSQLHIMNVVPDFGMAIVGSYFTKDHNAQIVAEAKKALQDWAQKLDGIPKDVVLHVDQGTIYEEVLKEAQRIEADAIVVGAHKSVLKDYLIGPNAARISRHAQQSVFVVR